MDRTLRACLLSMVAVGVVVEALAAALWLPLRGQDFQRFYADAVALTQGHPLDAASLNLNPPFATLLMAPLAALSFDHALQAWIVLSVVAAGLCARWIGRELGVDPTLVFGLMLLSTPGRIALWQGQVTFVLLPLLTFAWVADRRSDPRHVGVALGFLCAIKPFFGLFLVDAALRREWRTLTPAAVVGFGTLCVGLAATGVQGYTAWLAALREVSWQGFFLNGSVWGVASRFFLESPEGVYRAPFASDFGYAMTGWTLSVLIGAVTLFSSRNAGADRRWLTVGVASLLLSPLGWTYYLPMLIGPATALWQRSDRKPAWLLCGLLAFLPAELVSPYAGVLGTITVRQWGFVLTGALWLLAVRARPIRLGVRHAIDPEVA